VLRKGPDKIKKAPYRPDLPAGQFATEKFPVLTYGPTQHIELKDWRLRVFGLVENPIEFNWDAFTKLPWTKVGAPFHCVTQWSKLQNTWEGVLFTDIAAIVKAKPEAKFVIAHCYGDYTTNTPIDAVMDGMALIAHLHDGKPLTAEHGGPVRTVVPSRYGWKSAKWVNGIEFSDVDKPGFWEVRGYHNNGDYNKEERFWPELG
jgi:DMSO/TMAO reductase YedYZ molybdopterin-dependent catalytic subunit